MIEGVIYTPAGSARNFLEKGLWIDLTVGEALRRTAARVPNRIAFASEEGELTFRQLDERSERLGAALLDLGVQPGERAMFQMGTVLDTVVALTACYKAGIIPVCSVPQYREVEIGQLARLSGATLYFVQADFGSFDLVGFARGMQEKVPSLKHLIVARGRTDDQKRLIQSISLEAARRQLSQVKLTPEDCFVFQLSGGSTGVPKIIPRFHGEYLAHCDSWNRMHGMDEGSVAIWSLPIVHNAGQIFGYMGAIHWGRTTVLTSRIDIAHILDMIAKYRVTNAMSIGPIAPQLLAYRDLAKHDLSSLRYFVAFSRADAIEAHLGVKAANLYGITEGLVLISHPDDPPRARHLTQGRPGYTAEEIRILKAGTEEEVGPGEVGELCFRGPSSLRGYYNAPGQTREALTAQGLVRTGDLAKAHRIEGRLYYSFEGRLKDNINRGGEKFGTEEVENFIRQHPAVADVAVVAMPDEMLIERACAYVVPRPGMQPPDVGSLGGFLNSKGLAKFKFPERIEVVNAFPVTRVGKLDKAQLRKAIAEKLAREKNAAA
ncbi:MAG: (2,3-dihydroxybenzoyl)adenylate synthase [Betaproteobacteria bacterium]|nr:MAG: (2,3-dihydroxybenzoyl)adenylate synthase [Betaproteobacteria bacterium]